MYSRHFDLKRDPFSIAPDPSFLFMSERHREALAHLLFGVNGTGGFVLFTGDIGAGKTTVCRCFLEQIPPQCKVAIVFNPKQSVNELLQNICEEFHVEIDRRGGEPSLKSYVDALNAYLLQSHAAGRSNVLIIDEAQNLTRDVLEQLRLLTNLETYERKLLQIVLIGQPELRTMLDRPDLEQLAQRVIARYHLESLNEAETQQYIQHRMSVAGHTGPLPFDVRALRRIYALTRGVPRRINLLCGRVLLGAWASGVHSANRAMVDKAAKEIFGPPPPSRWAHALPYALMIGGSLALVMGIVYFLWPPHGSRASAQARAPVSAPGVVASAPVAEGSAPAPIVAPQSSAPVASVAPVAAKPRPLEDVSKLLARLPANEVAAWRSLGQQWKLSPTAEDPCKEALAQRLACHRTVDLTVPLLRQLDRPGMLTLQASDKSLVFAVLTGLNDQAATLLIDGAPHRVTLASLAQVWGGEFATFWQPPAGYIADLPDGAVNLAMAELSNRLSMLEGKAPRKGAGVAQALDGALKARVKAFQKGQGIKADGHPGPMTFMQLDKALSLNTVTLDSGAP